MFARSITFVLEMIELILEMIEDWAHLTIDRKVCGRAMVEVWE